MKKYKGINFLALFFIIATFILLFIGSIFYFIFSNIKKSKPYKLSQEFIKTNIILKQELGDNVKISSLFPEVNITITNGKGKARFKSEIKGNEKKGVIELELKKESKNKKWKITKAILYTDKEKIDIPLDEIKENKSHLNFKNISNQDYIIYNKNSIVKKAVMAHNYTSENKPIDISNIYSKTSPIIVLCIYVKNLDKDYEARAVWNFLDKNSGKIKIGSLKVNLPPDNNQGYWMSFFYKLNKGKKWPKGSYQVDLYIDDILDRSLRFYIK